MSYVWYYSAASFLFITVTAFFYFRQSRVPNLQDKLYSILLICSCSASLFDTLSAAAEPYAEQFPAWMLYASNMIFLVSLQLCLPTFFIFSLVLTSRYARVKLPLRLLICLPCAVNIVLILLSPLTRTGIFYLDKGNHYQHGTTYMLLYTASFFYLLLSSLIVLLSRRTVAPRKVWMLIAFCLIICGSIGLQLILKRYLLTTFATALALTVMCYQLLTTSERIDPVTELFNRSALSEIITSLDEQGQRFTLLTISITNYRLTARTLGTRVGERLLFEFARELRRRFPRRYLFRMGTGTFLLLEYGEDVELRLREVAGQIPARLDAFGTQVELSSWMASIKGSDFPDRALMLAVVEHVLHLPTPSEGSTPLLVDASAAWRLERTSRMQSALSLAITQNRIVVRYQPVMRGDTLWALEALPYVPDSLDLHTCPPGELFRIAETTGREFELSAAIFQRVCQFLKSGAAEQLGIDHVRIRLAYELCLHDGLSDKAAQYAGEYGVNTNMICFELFEANETEPLPTAEATISGLSSHGFRLALGSFGTGYNDFGRLSHMPLVCVRLSHILVRAAAESPLKQTLLDGIVGMLHELELTSMCNAVDQESYRAVVERSGADAWQGNVIAPAMSREVLLEKYCPTPVGD